MNGLEVILVLLAAASGLVVVAQRVRVPYPIVLVVGGLALAFVPGLPRIQIPPPLVLLLFLPPILFAAAWFTSWRDFATHLRAIGLLAIGLVIATTTAVAAVAHAVIPGMTWPVAFVLGAIVSPPDAVAATAVMQRLKVPRRIVTIIEGESLVNDATGLVAYQFAVAAVATGTFSVTGASVKFLIVAVGGVAFGFAVALVVAQIHKRIDDFLLETVMTLLTPYVAYIPAEHLGVSGVLAAVTAGGYLGWRNPQLFSPLTRYRSRAVWAVLLFLFNGLVFTLIGLELGQIGSLATAVPLPTLVWYGLAITGAAIACRLLWVPIATVVPRLVSPRLRARDPMPPWSHTALVAWTGIRGIVSLALALALPSQLPSGAPFPDRGLVIVLVFAVILGTLLVQGLSLPLVIRALRFQDDGQELREEREGLVRATDRALARLEEIDRVSILAPWLVERLRAVYSERQARLATSMRDDPECRLTEGEDLAFRRLRSQLIEAERRAIVELRNHGKLTEEALHRLQEDLDLEALQPLR
jgi:monovalent cation/hydrogen antiporter